MILEGKKIMVIGASRGIGSAIAHGCALEGACVVLVGRNQNTLEEVASELRSDTSVLVSTLAWDVSEVDLGPEVIKAAADIMGGLDVIIHNAGVIDHEPLLHVTEKEWDKLFDINVKGAYFCIQSAINYYLENKEKNDRGIRGKIIVVSSETGNQPHPKPYGVSKWAVMGMCKGFAKAFFMVVIICCCCMSVSAFAQTSSNDGGSFTAYYSIQSSYMIWIPEDVSLNQQNYLKAELLNITADEQIVQ